MPGRSARRFGCTACACATHKDPAIGGRAVLTTLPFGRCRGTIVGLTQYSTKAHICRAMLESVGFQVRGHRLSSRLLALIDCSSVHRSVVHRGRLDLVRRESESADRGRVPDWRLCGPALDARWLTAWRPCARMQSGQEWTCTSSGERGGVAPNGNALPGTLQLVGEPLVGRRSPGPTNVPCRRRIYRGPNGPLAAAGTRNAADFQRVCVLSPSAGCPCPATGCGWTAGLPRTTC